jgi:hypothetical protein
MTRSTRTTIDAPITWPAIAFEVIPSGRPWREEAIFMDSDWYFGPINRRRYKSRDWENLLIVDSAGRSFRILDAVKIGYAQSFLWWLLFVPPDYRLRFEAEEVAMMPYDELVERLCGSIEAVRGGWCNEDMAAGDAPDGVTVSEEDQIAAQIAAIRRCENLTQLFKALQNQPY